MARELEAEQSAGGDPTEERGPEYADADHDECSVQPGELDAPPEESQAAFSSEIDDAFAPETEIVAPHALDGLPAPVGEGGPLPVAPAFSIDNVVCVEDCRAYVELWADECRTRELYVRGPERVHLLVRDRYDRDGAPRSREQYEPTKVEHRWGLHLVHTADSTPERPEFVPVRPLRERCIHYKRQVMNNDEEPDPTQFGHKIVFRNCAARRSVGGALMSLRDQAVYACDYREPPDQVSMAAQDAKDAERLASRDHEVLIPFANLKPRST